MSKTIRLFWWNEKIIQGKSQENYGDVLGRYLVEKISKKEVQFAWPKKFSVWGWFSPIYVTIGSILANVNHKCVVWGSGIIDRNIHVKNAKFLAVRGPHTRKFLLDKGYNVPEVYGDPALLLPDYYAPSVSKKYTYGIVPHYNDYELIKDLYKDNEKIVVIDLMTDDIEYTTDVICSCERIISSSLHGIIVSHAYRIPAVWQKFSDRLFGDNVKFEDYMESVGLSFYLPEVNADKMTEEQMERLFDNPSILPDSNKIEKLKKGLMEVCPFK
ncbi:MAG: polysaccharide pyruvyl transferase family protein [Flavobacteriales bacterium]|nr:polysaccharide pyruvyl transferase family protein [Flavobacteriales bacterium]